MATRPVVGAIAASVASLTACMATPPPVYSIRRAALAPHMAPSLRDGQGMGDSAVEGQVDTSTLASERAPSEGDDDNAGLYVPTVELGAALRRRIQRNMDIGFVWDHGMKDRARAVSPDEPDPDNGSVYGGGLTFFYSFPTAEPGLRIGTGLDVIVYSVPYVEYKTCTTCQPMSTSIERDRAQTTVYAGSIIPSWRSGRVTVFGGATVRNHPTVPKGEVVVGNPDDDEGPVRGGPANWVAQVGGEVELGAGVRAMALLYQPLTRDPVSYGPSLGIGLTVPLLVEPPPPLPAR
jgi:hypothetical protein